jgi:hypothetical protein
MSIFNSTLKTIPCHSNKMRQARRWRCLNHNQSEGVGFGVCIKVHLPVWLQGEISQTETSQNSYWNRTLMHIHRNMKTFLLGMTVTQLTLLTQTSHS